MFRRRKKPTVAQRVRSWVWPRGGWRRFCRYLMLRLIRMPGSAYSIAAGFAVGAAVSFTPFVGIHIAISAVISWLIRANILASAIGTVVGNPWTFPFIWIWLYKSGNWILQNGSEQVTGTPDFDATFATIVENLIHLDVSGFFTAAIPVFWPMFLSGIPTALVVWMMFFFPLRRLIRGYQETRLEKLRDIADGTAHNGQNP